LQPASWPENNSLFCEPIVPPWGTVVLLSPAAGQFSVLSFVPFRVHSWFIRGSKRPAARTFQGRSRAGKPELQKFVHIRGHSWLKTTRREDPSGQISGWKARATKIRVHSCQFVVQNDPQRRPCRADLGLESPSYMNSCPFVSIRGSKRPAAETLQDRSRAGKPELQKFVFHSCPFVVQKHPQRRPFRTDLGLESPSYKNSCPFVSIRGSETPAAKTLPGRSRAGKPELHEFVTIRVNSWFKATRSEEPSGQISGWKARAT